MFGRGWNILVSGLFEFGRSSMYPSHSPTKCIAIASCLLMFLLREVVNLQYQVLRSTQSYDSAAEKCRGLGYEGLAVLDTPRKLELAKQVMIQELGNRNLNVWAGLRWSHTRHMHQWDDGMQMTWATWPSNEPNLVDVEDCVRVVVSRGVAKFRTRECFFNFFAICGNYSDRFTIAWPRQSPARSTSPVLSEGPARSFLECADICQSDSSCLYMSYTSDSGTCTTFGVGLTNADLAPNDYGRTAMNLQVSGQYASSPSLLMNYTQKP
ncbi:uncharacterized protein LOC101853372 [Aplysia californica]|uniref:Uncharacterized protein LOC101853372 n=1 Tax=Aplysia californica TaxID=6500 RepID=A0ABM0JGZ4_APLCA|nr:uncharacterized protein LOC101853372 [Aplysia californica]